MDASGSDTSDSGPLHAARPPRTNRDATKTARQRHRPWADGLAQEKQKAVAKAKKEADLEDMTKSRLKVVCRVRPQMRHERDEPPGVAGERQVGPWISVEPENERLEFTTAVLGPESTQRHCFVECAEPLLQPAREPFWAVRGTDIRKPPHRMIRLRTVDSLLASG